MSRDCIKLMKCLADKSRILIINNLMEEPMYVELLSQRLNLAASTISFHLKKLEDAELVYSVKEQYYIVYYLNYDVLSMTVKDLITLNDIDRDVEKEREKQYKDGVIKDFFEYGKLKSIPVQQKKRKIVMEKILESFKPNREYTEREVNIIIADFNDDFCTIRRDMVGFDMLERNNGIYKVKNN
ncbi:MULTISPECIES: metalloregulator ArsR/SmtB family transcription factor [Clostridium]|uniref:Uncharacterized protein n=1 Tax=Clostridium cadaveris TaxID=1529 RepID=A0A1I2PKF3_9CLOT|nr:metalloregulator ArsR/SmtB family transcription factor [Clostridium cadaveris]MDU4953090.1 metalloregulator ArsR/SmtB family transcription factor [Clostridium sp.]MDM8311688.1 metalloregulator ArsR/SmtB family transcription factor [Clostridium cadaveris]MDY4950324.1 metalloregulator ArsR/SmtB family transcription factor [Clostridium cadaveris]NME64319.1 metalloregulator ArsR/SmtB family transcription factor [Clostridium cadaveris]NWK11088.1 metalloregulator ArsR/SmtB family transcription fa